mgnify:CR=1 FL=1
MDRARNRDRARAREAHGQGTAVASGLREPLGSSCGAALQETRSIHSSLQEALSIMLRFHGNTMEHASAPTCGMVVVVVMMVMVVVVAAALSRRLIAGQRHVPVRSGKDEDLEIKG